MDERSQKGRSFHSEVVKEGISTASPKKREPTGSEKAAITKARDYCRSRTQPLAYEVEKVEDGDIAIAIPHNDAGGFIALQRATFGSVSPEFVSRMGGEVANIVRTTGKRMPDPDQLNAGIAAVAGIEPQNEVEAMLAVQMVGTHSVAMDMLSRAKQATSTDHLERYGTLATKLLRTYTQQIEALAKLRRKGEQTVRVEHVHVHSGGQAIVGPVTHDPKGAGGRFEDGRQAHAPTPEAGQSTSTTAVSPPVLRADAVRDGLPVARSQGQEAMPDARRRPRQRRTHG